MAKKQTEEKDTIIAVEETLSKTEQYIEDNKKSLLIIIVAIAVIIAGFYGYKNYYAAPREVSAQEAIYVAQYYFEKDSLDAAISGNSSALGFEDILNDYSGTKAANLANYYLGVIYIKKADYETAIDYLNDFSTDDIYLSTVTLGLKAMAYSELEQYDKAISFYEEAAQNQPNDFLTPIYLLKAGMLNEKQGNFDKALSWYKKLKNNYSTSQEGRQADKYIARIEAKK